MEKERGINIIRRNDNGYPLLEDGSIDWELTSKEKDEYMKEWERKNNPKQRSKNSNYTPPKKRRK